jgi:hypothetical protein
MGLSNQIPSSRIAQAGVVANTASRPVSPYEGQLIYQLDTNQLLVWDGSAWVAPNSTTANPPGLELITSGITCADGTVSNGVVTIGSAKSTVTISGCFGSSYVNYRIVIQGVDCSGNGAGGYFTFSGSTGSTYYSAGFYMAYSAATVNGTNQNGTSTGILWTVSGTETNDAIIDVMNPNVSGKTTAMVHWSNDIYPGWSSGYDSNSAAHTGFVLKAPATTTLTGGTIRVYGYRN